MQIEIVQEKEEGIPQPNAMEVDETIRKTQYMVIE